ALAPEGVSRRKKMLASLSSESVVIKAAGVELPPCQATIVEVDFKARKIKSQDWALAALAVLARQNKMLTMDMLMAALKLRFKKTVFEMAMAVMETVHCTP
ncbi:MAG: 2-oxoglutarate synthase, partial [Deltaproteobacteria bacterium]